MNQAIEELIGIKSWNDCFLLNINTIDKEHQRFFEIFDTLLSVKEDAFKHKTIVLIVNELKEYAYQHFKTEETLMRKAVYQEIEAHIVQHNDFMEQIRHFQLLYNPSKDSLLDELITFMRKWIVTHIYDEDFKYVEKIQLYLIRDEITKQQKNQN